MNHKIIKSLIKYLKSLGLSDSEIIIIISDNSKDLSPNQVAYHLYMFDLMK